MRSAAHYFKLSADQGLAEAECHYALCLIAGVAWQRNLTSAIWYLKL
jgi:TPR repeat protein